LTFYGQEILSVISRCSRQSFWRSAGPGPRGDRAEARLGTSSSIIQWRRPDLEHGRHVHASWSGISPV